MERRKVPLEARLHELVPRGMAGKADERPQTRWAGPADMGPRWEYPRLARRRGLFLGYKEAAHAGGKPIAVGVDDDRHALMVAGSRAGKGRSFIVPNLLYYGGSVVCIDPKGDLARITGRYRSEGLKQKCVVLDPFRESGIAASHCFNPLEEISADRPEEDAATMAAALIKISEKGETYWAQSAQQLVAALILLALTLDEADRNLLTVWQMLTLSYRALGAMDVEDKPDIGAKLRGIGAEVADDDIDPKEAAESAAMDVMRSVLGSEGAASPREKALFTLMRAAGERFPSVEQMAHSIEQLSPKERASIFSSARAQMGFLRSRALAATLKRSDFKLADLKRDPNGMTLYLSLPASEMAAFSGWLRLIIDLCLTSFERVKETPEIPVLMVLDEFHVLGHMQKIETAAAQIAGFGVKLWPILQDLSQLENLYDKAWQTFIGNSGVQIFFGNGDAFTLDYVAKLLGKVTMTDVRPSGAPPASVLAGSKTTQEQQVDYYLMEPFEIARAVAREEFTAIVTVSGRLPVIVDRALYDVDDAFKDRWDK